MSSTGSLILTRRSSTRSASAARPIFNGNAHRERRGKTRSGHRRGLRSAEPQKNDPGENNDHSDRALPVERLAERHAPEDRREHDRCLAEGGGGGGRKDGRGP